MQDKETETTYILAKPQGLKQHLTHIHIYIYVCIYTQTRRVVDLGANRKSSTA
ncbi:hypothetical protein Hanom_Chr05g00403311 [Helianthus anomalus]